MNFQIVIPLEKGSDGSFLQKSSKLCLQFLQGCAAFARMKDYIKWRVVKASINNNGCRPPSFRAKQIWWCNIGENVGVEMDGKGNTFLRPVLIMKKINCNAFWGLPLTSQAKAKRIYNFELEFKRKNGKAETNCALLAYAATWDALRLRRQIAEIDDVVFMKIKEALRVFLEL